MAAEGVAAQQDEVDGEYQRTDSDAKLHRASRWLIHQSALYTSAARKPEDDHREQQEVAMDVLQDQRERVFADIAVARLTTEQAGGSAQNAL